MIQKLVQLIRNLFLKARPGLGGLLFIICTKQLAGQPPIQPHPFRFFHLTVNEDLSHTDADDIVQDKNGFIWIATLFGLDRFDGYHVKRFYNRNEPFRNAFKNRIICLGPDPEGGIWLGTEGGLQRFDTRTETYTDFHLATGSAPIILDKIIKSNDGRLYGLNGGTLHCYNIRDTRLEEQAPALPKDLSFTDMQLLRDGILILSSHQGLWILSADHHLHKIPVNGAQTNDFNNIAIDPHGRLLLSSGSRLLLISGMQPGQPIGLLHDYQNPSGESLGRAVADNKGEYWVNAGKLLTRLDSALHPIQTIEPSGAPTDLHASVITSLFIDRSQCLWVGTFGHGVNYCDLNEKLFFTIQPQEGQSNTLSGNIVKSILDEHGERLWIGTNKGLNSYDYRTGHFQFYNDGSSGVKLKGDNVAALMTDKKGNLWIGDESGIEILDPGRRSLIHLPGSESFPKHIIETLVEDCYGNIWFGNHNDPFGVIVKDKDGRVHLKFYGEGFLIVADQQKPVLMVSSTNGLKRISVDSDGNILQTDTFQARSAGPSLSSSYTYPIRKIDDTAYWIGTIGGGLDRIGIDDSHHSFAVKTYGEAAGVFPDVESIEVDNSGKVWMGGNGLLCLDPATGSIVRYDKNDGLQGNSFKVNASFKAADGRLFFGGINGLNYFNPSDIQANPIAARPIFTDLLINNKPVIYGDSGQRETRLPQTLAFTGQLRLDYLQNNFVLAFSAMHFANPLKCRYRYKLNGYDQDWNYTDGLHPTAAYSNLDYGAYTFVVEATNNDGFWSNHSASLPIVVTPPWWKSTTAKWIYALLILGFLAGIYIYQGRWHRLKRQFAIREVNERKREEMHLQKEELYQQQLDFFANISHELRTPLSLISGPLENMISEAGEPARQQPYQLMLRNVRRLTNLISELMNFKKVADGAIRLRVEELSLAALCENLHSDFQNLADQKSIDFTFINHSHNGAGPPATEDPLTGCFDRQIVEKILINLLYNAFKYTDAGGSVQLEIISDKKQFTPSFGHEFLINNTSYTAGAYVYLLIRDTGIGITPASIRNIFDRYYRVSNEHIGSGVGLALVKSLTLLHKGTIAVYSQRNKGTEILVGLPLGLDNYTMEERAVRQDPISRPQLEPIVEPIDALITPPSAENGGSKEPTAKTILIVEDNIELCNFLSATLGRLYTIHTAGNGGMGLAAAMDKLPDLIISDVMMPEMNGIEFCRQIKSTFETSHIPFLILSAKDALESQIAGMGSGADHYLSKPVSIELLLLTVKNVFDHRDRLRIKYTKDYLTEATELVHTNKDKAFIQDLLNLIEANMQEPELDIDFLCSKLFTSRTQLYMKIKGITGQSTGEFIKTVRLKKAIQIMTHEDVPLSEVAERIGLQSASYFSRVFRKEYGKSPSEFMQSVRTRL